MSRVKAAVAALLATALLTLGVQAPAQAATLNDCLSYSNVYCMWSNAGPSGPIWRQVPAEVPYQGCRSLVGTGWNDVPTVLRNNAPNTTFLVYSNATCGGSPIEVAYGYTYDLTGSAWDNVISAVAWKWSF